MKIPASIRRLHTEQEPLGERLKAKVDERLRSAKHSSWHYESRLKSMESFAQKVESGRVENPSAMEDFFACTLVVRNFAELAEAEKLVASEFKLIERRPGTNSETHKRPEAFPFDDVRLYVDWNDDDRLPPTGLHGRRFEIQVKTFLQHAWGIATHDLIYKTAEPDWGTQRIAYQVKAVLEHAETSIQEARLLSRAPSLCKTTNQSRRTGEFVQVIRQTWDLRHLPGDVRRLAENVADLCKAISLGADELGAILEEETNDGRGASTRNLSPFAIVVDSLLRRRRNALVNHLRGRSGRRTRFIVVLPSELDLPSGEDTSKWKNAMLLE